MHNTQATKALGKIKMVNKKSKGRGLNIAYGKTFCKNMYSSF